MKVQRLAHFPEVFSFMEEIATGLLTLQHADAHWRNYSVNNYETQSNQLSFIITHINMCACVHTCVYMRGCIITYNIHMKRALANTHEFLLKRNHMASQVTQQEKALATRTHNLISIPGTYVVEGEHRFLQVVL